MATVSIRIPAFNGARYISETIASVLSQTYEDFEVIVVDDCSGDGTRRLKVAEEPPLLF